MVSLWFVKYPVCPGDKALLSHTLRSLQARCAVTTILYRHEGFSHLLSILRMEIAPALQSEASELLQGWQEKTLPEITSVARSFKLKLPETPGVSIQKQTGDLSFENTSGRDRSTISSSVDSIVEFLSSGNIFGGGKGVVFYFVHFFGKDRKFGFVFLKKNTEPKKTLPRHHRRCCRCECEHFAANHVKGLPKYSS